MWCGLLWRTVRTQHTKLPSFSAKLEVGAVWRNLIIVEKCQHSHGHHYSVHLTSSNPTFSNGNANKKAPKGVFCRNTALEWLMENNCQTGVFYFADDDNTYDRRVFNLIRSELQIPPRSLSLLFLSPDRPGEFLSSRWVWWESLDSPARSYCEGLCKPSMIPMTRAALSNSTWLALLSI